MNKYEKALDEVINSIAQHLTDSVKRFSGLDKDVGYYREMLKSDTDISRLQELVKRATPMKPIMSGAYQGLTFDVCPICDKSLPNNSKFCSQCGQAIMRGDK